MFEEKATLRLFPKDVFVEERMHVDEVWQVLRLRCVFSEDGSGGHLKDVISGSG